MYSKKLHTSALSAQRQYGRGNMAWAMFSRSYCGATRRVLMRSPVLTPKPPFGYKYPMVSAEQKREEGD